MLQLRPHATSMAISSTWAKDDFVGTIATVPLADGSPVLQLQRLVDVGEIIRDAVLKRIKGKSLSVNADWRSLLDTHLDAQGTLHANVG
jgi:hypothetical protein